MEREEKLRVGKRERERKEKRGRGERKAERKGLRNVVGKEIKKIILVSIMAIHIRPVSPRY